MANLTTIQPTAPLERDEPNTLENRCPTEESACRIFALTHGLYPVSVNAIRQLIMLETIDREVRS